ncbi:MAG TPA: sigma factor-like helix-turn-helix DNA-binding protein [Mycobacterium sp.]|nr:sigma factor-like helix-turn-helix DNA-binding protein [Mycobacterium sp.]
MRATGLTARFEQERPQLTALAYRMLGTFADAEDTADQLPDPIVESASDPEQQALLADAVGLALFVVLDTLAPAERLAFVLHDVFAVPFDEIAPIIERSPAAARQLASRARRRVRSEQAIPDGDMAAQRSVVDAFFAAGRSGDFERLIAVLHRDVRLRGDFGPGRAVSTHGASAVARLAKAYAALDNEVRPARVNGAAGAVIVRDGRPAAVMGFVVVADTVRAIDVLADLDRIVRLDLDHV